jgi:photosystem II stability/assembly factor-like uncharacterized protein
MQKLVWQNSNGDVIDLTSGNYNITNWEGFSNADLNIQSQQVPFQDGGVFLDALIEQRELSVTLAMNDNGNLEERYRMRRELIHALNPKLGEGYLIYTNDFISKRIKCVAQIPLFETHNSNDSGTPKASLAWTACEPYWEDVEEKKAYFGNNKRIIINNSGDVPCNMVLDLMTNNTTNPSIKNIETNKTIKLEGIFNKYIKINTEIGNKQVLEEEDNLKIKDFEIYLNSIADNGNITVIVGGNGIILTSSNGINWNIIKSNIVYNLYKVIYVNELEKFVCVGGNGIILTSSNGINWNIQTSGTTNDLSNIDYSENLNLLIAIGSAGTILTSSDGITWNSQTSGIDYSLFDLACSEDIIVIVGNGKILTSPDGITWTQRSNMPTSMITYSKELGYFILIQSTHSYISYDGISWEYFGELANSAIPRFLTYLEEQEIFIAINAEGYLHKSVTGKVWNVSNVITSGANPVTYHFSKASELFIITGAGGSIFTSLDNNEWKNNSLNTIYPYTNQFNNNFISVDFAKDSNLLIAICKPTLSSSIYILKSYDSGKSWIVQLPEDLTDDDKKIKYISSKNKWFILGEEDNKYLKVSEDGENWEKIILYIPNEAKDIIYADNLKRYFYCTGHYIYEGNGEDNYTSWIPHNVGNKNIVSLAYSKVLKLLVAVGNEGTIFYSLDGETWIATTSNITENINCVMYSENNNIFVAVGNSGKIITSIDGVNWDIQTSGITTNLNYVSYFEDINTFYIVGENGLILKSFDGLNWNDNLSDIYYTNFTNCVFLNKINEAFIMSNDILLTVELITKNNIIASLDKNSDLNFNLEIGENQLLLNSEQGNISSVISYRQKYIGV